MVAQPWRVGLVLAGIFAATMSTADSLILSCSASITHDLLPVHGNRAHWPKLATVLVTAAALGIALSDNHSVFSLVLFAWSALASAFAPLLFVYAAGGRPGQRLAIVMLVTGVAVAVGWRALGWHDAVYEGMPGILAGIVFTFVPMLGDDVVSKIIGGQRVVMLSGAMLDLITALNYSVAAAMSAFVILLVAALQILFVLTIRRIGGGAAMIEGLRR